MVDEAISCAAAALQSDRNWKITQFYLHDYVISGARFWCSCSSLWRLLVVGVVPQRLVLFSQNLVQRFQMNAFNSR